MERQLRIIEDRIEDVRVTVRSLDDMHQELKSLIAEDGDTELQIAELYRVIEKKQTRLETNKAEEKRIVNFLRNNGYPDPDWYPDPTW